MIDIHLRIRLDAQGAGRHLGHRLQSGVAFFVLGAVQAILARSFGARNCQVELSAATGVNPGLLTAMSGFAPALQRALATLEERGEVRTREPGVAEVLAMAFPVHAEADGDGWLIRRVAARPH